MLIHIVKTGETIDKITDSYRILKSDLISNNLHITDFSHLKSGMKLKIPLICKDSMETLEETEAFIDDYYPSFEKFLSNNESVIEQDVIEVKEEIKVEQPITHENIEEVKVHKETTTVNNENKIEKPYNNNVYSNYYGGNIIPKYNEKFIRKI